MAQFKNTTIHLQMLCFYIVHQIQLVGEINKCTKVEKKNCLQKINSVQL